MAPFSYVYPALFGADAMRIKIANIVLFVLLILIVFRIGSLLHSRRAGLAAAVLLAASPTIKIFIPTALTEPPFIFLVGVWIWALCEGHRSGRTQWWIASGLALGLAILTRPTYLYFAPLARSRLDSSCGGDRAGRCPIAMPAASRSRMAWRSPSRCS